MQLTTVTLTGADDATDPSELLEISQAFPFVEWGILLHRGKAGAPRYPGLEWVRDLATLAAANSSPRPERPRFAAHLCGSTMSDFLQSFGDEGGDESWCLEYDLTESAFNRLFSRTQINMNARRLKITPEHLRRIMKGWHASMDGCLITQHNPANADVWRAMQAEEFRHGSMIHAHQVLHDASGGRGRAPEKWDRPIAGILNGYAGGISPDTVLETINKLDSVVGEGLAWIDMEASLRDADDRFDLDRIRQMLEKISKAYF